LQSWHQAEIAPDNITVYMIGDINIEDATKAVKGAFGRWTDKSASATQEIGDARTFPAGLS
jgi:predicted Zn-dependent peptidase